MTTKFIDTTQEQLDFSLTKEGYLVLDAPLTRTGVFEYQGSELKGIAGIDPNRTYKIGRRDEDVFSPASIASFEGQPITFIHPDDLEVDAKNWKEESCGHIQNIYRKGDQLRGKFYIHDADTIKKIQTYGAREVSCGYDSKLVKGDGPVDFYQTEVVGNHAAIVPSGRAGSTIRLGDSRGKRMAKKPVKFTDSAKALRAKADKFIKTLNDDDVAVEQKAEETKDIADDLKDLADQIQAKAADVEKKAEEIRTETEILDKAKAEFKDEQSNDEALKQEVEMLRTENAALKEENAALKEELQALKDAKESSSIANDAKTRFGDSVKFTDASDPIAMKQDVLVQLGVFSKDEALKLNDASLDAAYAALRVSHKRQPDNKLGNILFGDSCTEKKADQQTRYGGKK